MILYISRKSNLLQISIGRSSIFQLFQLFTCRAVTVHVIAIGFSDFLSDFLICRRPGFWSNIPAVNQFNAYACCECCQKVRALCYAFKFVLRDRFAHIFFPKLLPAQKNSGKTRQQLLNLCLVLTFIQNAK